MEKKNNKVLIIFISVAIAVIMGAILFIAIKTYQEKHKVIVNFSYVDEINDPLTVEVGTEKYIPPAMLVTVDDVDMTNLLKIDIKNLDLTELGTYKIRYYLEYQKKTYEIVKEITVVDTTKPVITLKGKNQTLLLNEKYEDPGYEVTDNYDKDLKDKVTITSNVDVSKAGTYKITYNVTDSSGNKADEKVREVTIKKPNTVVSTPPKETKVEVPKVVVTNYENTLKKNKFTSTRINLEGYLKEPLEENKLRLVNGEDVKEYPLTVTNNSYSINLNPDEITNGSYKVYINEEPLLNKMAMIDRLVRAKVGSKLVTFSYNNDEVSIKIEPHNYQYDIVINPGHGGSDTGAVNEYITEKEMNLTVSMYEKCRYEAHGLSVYMTRTGDYYGDKMGPSDLIRLHKVAYEMGYYGAVSRIVYSNHHNSIGNDYFSGYEVLVAGELTSSELANELAIANKWNSIYNLTENHTRFYARDYDTETIYSKLNGEIYSFKNNYAVNRIPYAIFNVKSIIYEGCYMSNKKEFLWYWNDANWYKVSEAKIETYVTSLGISYNPDSASCM